MFYELDQERMWAAKDNEKSYFFLQVTNNHPEETIDSLNGVQVSIRRYGNFSRMILKNLLIMISRKIFSINQGFGI